MSVEAFREHARERARTEREAVEWAVAEIETLCDDHDVDLEPLLEYARASRRSLPERHRAAYEAMASVFDVDAETYEAYALAFGDLCDELAGAVDGRIAANTAQPEPAQGCTNALVAPSAADCEGSFVLKNRDVAGRGVRPKAVVEQPALGDYHGFLTIDTCGTVMVFKGVNDAGLVAANTYVDISRDDVGPEEELRNGVVIRRLLEETASVREARALLESVPTRRLAGQTLFLADDRETVLLEVDPVADRIAAVDEDVVVRTNHFCESSSPTFESSTRRRERALELLEDARGERAAGAGERGTGAGELESNGRIGRDDLWALARDHENGPGDDSICRHPEPEADAPHAFGQLTTVSAAVFEGGEPTMDVVLGNPCETEPTRFALGEPVPADLRSGRRWLALGGRSRAVGPSGETAVPLEAEERA